MRSFSPYRRVKMEPEANITMMGGGATAGWGWGAAAKPPAAVGWSRSLQSDDSVTAHAAFTASGAGATLHSQAGANSTRGLSPHAEGHLEKGEGLAAITNARHPAGFRGFFPAAAASAASMPTAHIRFHPAHAIPSRDSLNHRLVLYPSQDVNGGGERDSEIAGSDVRKPSSGDANHRAHASSATSLHRPNDIMCGLTSSQACGQPVPSHCPRESPNSTSGLQHLSTAHSHPAMVVGAFSGVGAGLSLDCGGVGAGDNGGGSESSSSGGGGGVNGYDNTRGAFLIPSGKLTPGCSC